MARVIADVTITAAGYLGTNFVIKVTLLPPLVICVASLPQHSTPTTHTFSRR
jgi:hypothetical protein